MTAGRPLFTIGYEGATQAAVIDRLASVGVALLIDVRAVASSRKAGFSKTLLSQSLASAGIGYRHLRDLGTPKEGRLAARAGRTLEMRRIFLEHMRTSAAQAALAEAARAASETTVCLLCYEEDYRCCHRAILADMLGKADGVSLDHLRLDPLARL